jgi:formylglycine-generating enzyme required for sulfatase activity
MNYVLNRERLVAARKVVPKDFKKSRLFRRMRNEEMPPEADAAGNPIKVRLTDEEMDAVKRWIAAGAPDFAPKSKPRPFITNTDILEYIHKDLLPAGEQERRFRRYFTITHLYNAGLSEDELLSYRVGLAKLVNSLSWGHEVKVPVPIDPAQTVFRIDLRDYGWKTTVWDQIVTGYPYGITYRTRTAEACSAMCQTALPHVRADWFVFAASRPPLYHEVLDLPQTDRELEKILHVDVEGDVQDEDVARAGFNGSGVSRNNRLIERHRSPYGSYWKSYDFASNVDRQNLFQHPLGPGKAEHYFKPDGGEIIFSLPNGLQGYFLVDGNGKRIAKGPINIVSDAKQADRAVVNGVSCMSCHNRGMILKADQVREHALKNPSAFNPDELAVIKALYPPGKEFRKLVRRDAERFRKAVEATGAHLSKTEPVYTLAGSFEKEIDLRTAAAEVGVSAEDFAKGLGRSTELARVFGPLRVEGGTIQRQVLVAHFADLAGELLPDSAFGKNGEAGLKAADKHHVADLGGVKMELVRVPRGIYFSGSPENENGRFRVGEEQKQVFIAHDFYIGKFEVTQGQWEALMGKDKNPSFFSRKGGGNRLVNDLTDAELAQLPVENITWAQAQEFVQKLNDRKRARNKDWRYRLPTEAEWEYACRGGPAAQRERKKTSPFHFAEPTFKLSGQDANCDGRFPAGGATRRQPLGRPCKVGSYKPNVLGIYDMHGNAYEWCGDLPKGSTMHPFRGGSWLTPANDCRAAKRIFGSEFYRRNDLGFRVVRVPARFK